jgi:hypothetical protein
MKTNKYLLLSAMLAIAVMAVATSARAQVQTTGTPGSPSATTTIDGKQIPPPPMPFGGLINESVKDSKPYWPPRVVAPKGAPNILLIMTDDQGYGISSTFGGVIPTPAMDRVAKAGLRGHQCGLLQPVSHWRLLPACLLRVGGVIKEHCAADALCHRPRLIR